MLNARAQRDRFAACSIHRDSQWLATQPQWGEAWTRNMVSNERAALPESFDIKDR